jgi:hypothetical protein
MLSLTKHLSFGKARVVKKEILTPENGATLNQKIKGNNASGIQENVTIL